MKRVPLPDIPPPVVEGARLLGEQSDRLFLGAVSAVSNGLDRVGAGVASVGSRMSPRRLATKLGLRAEKTTRDRIVALLVAEAKRRPIDVSPEDFEEFAEKMGLLFELIFSGAIRVEDIALEGDETAEWVDGDEQSSPSSGSE